MRDLRPAQLRLVEPDFVDRVPAPAYDSLAAGGRRDLLADNPDSYLAVTQSQEDEPTLSAEAVLARSRVALDRLRSLGAFGSVQEPRLLLYRLEVEGHQQTAIVAELSVDAIRHRRLRPHEQVFPGRARILADHLHVVGAQSSPIAVAHPSFPALDELVASVTDNDPPLRDFVAPDGLRQSVWAFPHPEALAALDGVPLYLLDGHHRAAAALDHADRYGLGPDDAGSWLLAALFPADSLRIVGFDRRVLDPRFTAEQTLDLIAEHARLTEVDEPFRPTVAAEVGVYLAGRWYRATLPDVGQNAIVGLAPVLLQSQILGPVFGIVDPQHDHRLEHLPGTRPAVEAAAETDDEGGVLFTIAPIRADELMAVADDGLVLPPKSTFITPKVRSGIFLREL
ncbi:MAG: DUF1015 family protein [Acidimicrobiales bacterium]